METPALNCSPSQDINTGLKPLRTCRIGRRSVRLALPEDHGSELILGLMLAHAQIMTAQHNSRTDPLKKRQKSLPPAPCGVNSALMNPMQKQFSISCATAKPFSSLATRRSANSAERQRRIRRQLRAAGVGRD